MNFPYSFLQYFTHDVRVLLPSWHSYTHTRANSQLPGLAKKFFKPVKLPRNKVYFHPWVILIGRLWLERGNTLFLINAPNISRP